MKIKLAGHSGCQVAIERRQGQLVVLKQTNSPEYFARLKRQADKQEKFLHCNKLARIGAPRILERIETPQKYGMVMEYIHSRTFIDFFENSSCSAPQLFSEKMIEFLEWEFTQSPRCEIPEQIFTAKLHSIRKNIEQSPILSQDSEILKIMDQAEKILGQPKKREWPLGMSHGDLTLSNLLFQDARIYLIDFLDSFIETPLMDLVKLRQDTHYFWSFLLFTENFDQVKNSMILEYVDHILWEHFKNFPGVSEGYYELQYMNFLRILQYAHDPKIIQYLKKVLNELGKGVF